MAPSLSALFTDCKVVRESSIDVSVLIARSSCPLPFRRRRPAVAAVRQAEAEKKRVLLAADGRIEFKVEGWAPGHADEASVRRKTALFVCYTSL